MPSLPARQTRRRRPGAAPRDADQCLGDLHQAGEALGRGLEAGVECARPASTFPPSPLPLSQKCCDLLTTLSPEWATLAARAGDGLTLHLLTRGSVFHPLPTPGAWAQLAGPPPGTALRLLHAAREGRRARSRRGGRGRGGRAAAAAAARPPRARSQPPRPPPTPPPTGSGAAGDGAIATPSDGGWAPAGAVGAAAAGVRRPARPPSWRRRAAAAARQRAAAVDAEPAASTQGQGGAPIEAPKLPAPAPPRPSPSRAARRRAARAAAAAASASGSPLHTDMPRWGLFHHAPFRAAPGLPRSHPLVAAAAPTTTAPGRRLFSLVFGDAARLTSRAEAAWAAGRWWEARALFARAPRPLPAPARRVAARDRSLPPLLALASARAAKCPYGPLLEAHCPLTGVEEEARAGRVARRAARRAARAAGRPPPPRAPAPDPPPPTPTPHTNVTAFAWAVLRRVVPSPLLGGARARRSLRVALARLVSLRRHERLPAAVAAGWDAPPPPALAARAAGAAAAAAAAARSAQWRRWLLARLVLPLVRAHFYVTDGGSTRLRPLYHRKPAWAASAAAATRAALAARFARLPPADVARSRLLGLATLRPVPKPGGGVRLVTVLSRAGAARRKAGGAGRAELDTAPTTVAPPPGPPARRRANRKRGKRPRASGEKVAFPAVNHALLPAHRALAAATAASAPAATGASAFGVAGACAALRPALVAWRGALASHRGRCEVCARDPRSACPSRPRPVLVTADVASCFDSVSHAAVWDAASSVLSVGAAFDSAATAVAAPPPGGAGRATARTCVTTVVRGSADAAARPVTGSFLCRVGAGRPRRVYAPATVPRGPACLAPTAASTLARLVTGTGVVFGGSVWVPTAGVPQGARASTLLASLALARLEAAHLAPLLPPPAGTREACAPGSGCPCAVGAAAGAPLLPTVLSRVVDDFLLLTPCPAAAAAFAARLQAGFPEAGVAAHPAKGEGWAGGAPVEGVRLPPPPSTPGSGRRVRWCGLAFDGDTLAVTSDPGTLPARAGDGLTLPRARAPAAGLALRAAAAARARLAAPLLLDPGVASPAVAARNARDALRVASARAFAHWRALPPASRPPPRALARAILSAGDAVARLAAARAAAVDRAAGAARRRTPPTLTPAAARWLAAAAGVDVLAGHACAKRAARELRAVLVGDRVRAAQLAPTLTPRRP